MNKSFGSIVVDAVGFKNLPFLENDCRNYIDKAKHMRLGKGGAGALQEYFLRMQYKNLEFFALMDLDDDERLNNVFWADLHSRVAYQYFSDVVTFDTTYLMNRYGMPFAPFAGVNHHGQSILLAPRAITTDQDRAVKNAIAIVFPESRHRFCLWQILKKVPEKLSSHASYKNGMKTELMKSVYDTQSVEEFEESWDQLITTYNLHENAWLQSLYAERQHWTNLKEFVDQFDNSLKKKIENETAADFHSFNVTIPCISRSPIKKKFKDLYTNAKFGKVQQQITGIIDMDPKLLKSDGVVKTYHIEDEICVEEFTKQVTHYMDFSEEDTVAKCSSGSDKHTVDATQKLFAMIDLYGDNQESPSMMVTGSNRDGGDTPVVATCRNLFATSQSMQYGLDDSQPVQYGMDEHSPMQLGFDETTGNNEIV
ncbi:protein FAR1-RELATED SEQUENCE 5-like [Juglans regia]|uniref:Protein FAR1-RELATED SEQUENCE n=1 Tax=Juglans regia TaxID=51240 RepID=A0A6P9DY80_JUGRE|nr:protein FAR1-RELATED SEQUENCE 5-like [Juglans regia]